MTKSLVIVESPAKAKTISKILGRDFQVKASVGHIRDLPRNKLGVDVKKNFEPQYEVLHEKTSIVAELKLAAKSADHVYLAPDPDREGEAIAWHLSELLNLPKSKLHRIEFNEITKDAVLAAMKKPRQIDKSRVNAQQARRVLDRLVGYKISPLLWRRVNGRSAGRVQSVAVRIICEREVEIEAFKPQEYWSIKAQLSKQKHSFIASLYKYGNKRVIAATEKATATSFIIGSSKEAEKIVKAVQKEKFEVAAINEKSSQRQPSPPFITSSLQREASSQLGFAVKKTMQVAQSLYEGVELGKEGPVGLITYMRTDSTRIAKEAQDEALKLISTQYGKKYLPTKPRVYSRKAANVQDAHEAIRPSYVKHTPESIRRYLTPDQNKLYKLIWERFMASQMAAAELLTLTVEIEAGDALFRVSDTQTKFDGFMLVYNRTELSGTGADSEESEDEEKGQKLPALKKKDKLDLLKIDPRQHFTQPPPRFNEASLVKTLEELGIGRPSTYAATVSTIVDRKYVDRENKVLSPTKLGRMVNALLVEHFPSIIDVKFTAQMELQLDQIEEDHVEWHGMLKDFYVPFGITLKKAKESMDKIVILSEEFCSNCGKQMALKSSRFGQFLGCTGYPECTTTIALTREGKPVPEDRPSNEICRTCSSPMLIRYGRYGDYLTCSAEDCKEQRAIIKTTGVKCPRPDCGGEIVEKKSRRGKMFYGCSNYGSKKCTTAFWYPPVISGGPKNGNHCPRCKSLLIYKTLKRGNQIVCADKECDFAEEADNLVVHA
jgi:DNA topoisomerase I